MNYITRFNYLSSNILLKKVKIFLLIIVFSVSSINVFAQTSSLISSCGDFVAGSATAWPHVLVATTIDSGAISQASQTYTMNIISLPAGGANVRVYKTVGNGNDFFGNPIALTLGSNSITVPAVTFDRAVKFQFSNGSVEFDALTLNGVASTCVAPLPPPTTSLISICGDFISGPAAWPYVLEATTIVDGVASQASQTFTMNITSLPVGGANVRVYKTTANGNSFFGNPVALTLGSNSITVPAVTFDRAVKFQFSSGDVEFDALSLNGVSSNCVCISSSIDTVSTCDNYTWIDGNTYTTSNSTATYTIANSAGCDSVITLNLTINSSSSASTINIIACDSYNWNGFTFTNTGIFTQTLTNVEGCDSVITLNLTINSSSSASTINITACDSYNWNGFIFTTSGIYTQSFTNIDGCDSIVTLNLTINGLSSSSLTNVTSCDSYDWNGNTFTSSGIYSWTGTNTVGCDSIATLNLTINNSSSSSINITACQSFDWNGNTYTFSGTYIWTGTNSFGCDSTASLVLVITSNSTTSNISVCNDYIWNGITYSSSGIYTYNNGTCIDSLILTINNSSTSSNVISSCDSYSWNGNTYTSSGIYAWTGTNTVGCDSIATLDLTINNSSSYSDTISACGSINWNGTIYTSSGIYSWTGTNTVGCDSVATLDLTINNSSSSFTILSACDSLHWNGNTYDTSGIYTWTGTNADGCDSVSTLDLTITNIDPTVSLINDSTLQVQSNIPVAIYQWLDCNNNFSPIIGETNSTFVTQNPGFYAVEIVLNDCSVITDCYSITSTSIIDAFDLEYRVKLFPNPTTNYLNISLEGINKVDITILDLQGKVILQNLGVLNNEQINLSSYIAGNYIVKITTPFGIEEIQVTKY